MIIKAANFAALKHRNQRRKDANQTPYINHPIGVAFVLAQECEVTDEATLVAALLHDTVEDTDTSLNEIEMEFGNEVRKLVEEVTDDKSLPKLDRKRLQIEHAPHASVKAKVVKMADKIYNLRDLNQSTPVGWSGERVEEYFEWAKKVTDGCRGVNPKIEKILDELYAARGL